MRRLVCWGALAVVLSLVECSKTFAEEPIRTWTTTDGETMEARWDRPSKSNSEVIRLVSNGETYEINVADLSSVDQDYVQTRRQGSEFREVPSGPSVTLSGVFGNRKAGERMTKTVDGIEYAFRWCPTGMFMMGSPSSEEDRSSDKNQHEVTLTQGFWMMETEVTQAMWCSVMGESISGKAKQGTWGHDLHGEGPFYPMYCVSWDDC